MLTVVEAGHRYMEAYFVFCLFLCMLEKWHNKM